jgi:hypothetical protein
VREESFVECDDDVMEFIREMEIENTMTCFYFLFFFVVGSENICN